jgi:hypothetical protein
MTALAGLQISDIIYSVMYRHIPGESNLKIKLSPPSLLSVIMAAQSKCRCVITENLSLGLINL